MNPARSRATKAGGVLRAVVALVLLGACSASPDTVPEPGRADLRSSTVRVSDADGRGVVHAVRLRSRVTRVAGHLTDVRRDSVARGVRATVLDYLEGAFAAGGHPPFRRFTSGLRRAARADAEVLRQPGGAAGSGPAVPRAEAWFSVAAPEGRPVGVTARLRVELARGSVTGRLLLSRADGAWQVFGYDLARSGRASAGSGASR